MMTTPTTPGIVEGKAVTDIPQTIIGLRIRQARLALDWTQAELGARVRASQGNVARWETGRHKPNAASIIRLESVLDVKIFENGA